MMATPSSVTSPENASASMICLSKLVFSNLPDDWNLSNRLEESFSLFSSIVNLASPLDMESFFIHGDFDNRKSIQTPYGIIDSYKISTRLKSKLLQRDHSLRQLCILRMIESAPSCVTVDDVLELPKDLFRSFMVTAFLVHWLPMTHIKFHPDMDEIQQEVPLNLQCVFEFISHPRIFERMYDDCRNELTFIVCWLQHAHFYELNDEPTPAIRPSNTPTHSPDHRPLLQPHRLSIQFVRTLEQLLQQLGDCSTSHGTGDEAPSSASSVSKSNASQNSVLAVMRLGLKIASFLCDSSEYVHAVKATRRICAHLHLINQDRIQHSLRYEALCIMLRAMNTHSMYLDPEDQQVFQKDAPNLLLSMQEIGMLLRPQPNAKRPASYYVLPPHLAVVTPPLYPTVVGSSATTKGSTPAAKIAPTTSNVDEALGVVRKVRAEWAGDQAIRPSGSGCCADVSQSPGPAGDVPVNTSGAMGELNTWKQTSVCNSDGSHLPSGKIRLQALMNRRSSSSSPCDDPPSSAPHESKTSITSDPLVMGAFLYTQLATYHYTMCTYELAYQFTLLAIEQFRACWERGAIPSAHSVIEFLRIMCKMCMIKRNYDLGAEIIKYALMFTRHYYGTLNLTYANLLVEYGCLLLNTDKTRKAARVYRIGFALILNCLPGASVMSALALEAIAYAHYVLEYTSGDFAHALKCSEIASLVLCRLKHQFCMQWASANRVKALIIEEIAIDANDPALTARYLEQAKDLHMQSLDLCKQTFGIYNIQTAKHFGNLGRLYQSMQDTAKAEEMHKKAILIKTQLLGDTDFEVGLSLGHLASLYNYDLGRYEDAEKLYLGSIEISRNLFGSTYSGLEYDYRGLQRVYYQLDRIREMNEYTELCRQWYEEREQLRRTRAINDHVVDELEPADVIRGDPLLRLWPQFISLLDQYEQTFAPLFHGFGLPPASDTTPHCSRQGTPNTNKLSSTATPEASRSTGY